MIIKTKTLQDNCKKILDAVDTSTGFSVSETLELEVREQSLYLNVTNREYYVSVRMPLGADEDFHAVVDAKVFLSLISKLTTGDVELRTTDTMLLMKADGSYKIPLIYDDEGKMASLPKIVIGNVTNSFPMKNSVLQSILKYNSKELLKAGSVREVQKLFYIDQDGALTFSTGACVNAFSLEQPLNIYLNEKTVKLFKLFSTDVMFSIGQDELGGTSGKVVTKVSFDGGDVLLVSILNIDSSITNTFPVKAIRNLASRNYEHSVTLDKDAVLGALNRLLVFTTKSSSAYTYMVFGRETVTIYDTRKDNYEVIGYPNATLDMDEDYTAMFITSDLKLTLESCDDKYVNLGFGNHTAVTISRGTIKNIIPECIQ